MFIGNVPSPGRTSETIFSATEGQKGNTQFSVELEEKNPFPLFVQDKNKKTLLQVSQFTLKNAKRNLPRVRVRLAYKSKGICR